MKQPFLHTLLSKPFRWHNPLDNERASKKGLLQVLQSLLQSRLSCFENRVGISKRGRLEEATSKRVPTILRTFYKKTISSNSKRRPPSCSMTSRRSISGARRGGTAPYIRERCKIMCTNKNTKRLTLKGAVKRKADMITIGPAKRIDRFLKP